MQMRLCAEESNNSLLGRLSQICDSDAGCVSASVLSFSRGWGTSATVPKNSGRISEAMNIKMRMAQRFMVNTNIVDNFRACSLSIVFFKN